MMTSAPIRSLKQNDFFRNPFSPITFFLLFPSFVSSKHRSIFPLNLPIAIHQLNIVNIANCEIIDNSKKEKSSHGFELVQRSSLFDDGLVVAAPWDSLINFSTDFDVKIEKLSLNKSLKTDICVSEEL